MLVMPKVAARLVGMPVSALLLAALFAFAVTHPYVGVRHDGVLYTAQALRHLEPAVFGADPFFAFGSQDQFTVFGRVYAQVIGVLGLPVAAKLGALLALLASFVAAAMLLRQLQTSRAVWMGLCWMACSPLIYSELAVFSVQEGFFTARSLAEPLSLLALAAVMAGRHVWALWLFALSASMHPIMTLPAVCVAVVWALIPSWGRGPVVVAAALGLLACSAGLWLAGQGGVLLRMDPAWVQVVDTFTPFVFLSNWTWNIWGILLAHLIVLALCVRWLDERVARLALAVMVVVLGLSLAAGVAQALSIQLAVAAQLWRANWLLVLVGTCLAPPLAWALWRRELPAHQPGRVPAAKLAVMLLAGASFMTLLDVGAAALPAGLAALLLWRADITVSRPVAWLCAGMLGALIVGLTALQVSKTALIAATFGLPDSMLWMGVLAKPAILIATLMFLASLGLGPWLPPMMVGVAAAWFAYGWDQRDDWIRHIESGELRQAAAWQSLPKGASVYWPESLELTWVGLGHASYFQSQQTSGVVFSRQTALELWRRHAVVEPMAFQIEVCTTMDAMNASSVSAGKCEISPDAARETCKPGGPDIMVLSSLISDIPPVARWRPSVRSVSSKVVEMDRYIYDCARIRAL